jgi:hypothetical protein
MRSVYEERRAEATEIDRQIRRGADKIVGRKFGAVAKLLWPFKTAAHLATIASSTERTAERWLSGEFEPPAIVIAAIIVEITKRS